MAQTRERLVSFTKICRGKGKIYAILDTSPDLDGVELKAVSRVRSGEEVPAVIMNWRRLAKRVLVLPILSIAQTCDILAAIDGDEFAVVATRTFRPTEVRVQSVAHRMAKDVESNLIRNADAHGARSGCTVRVRRTIPSEAPDLIIHGDATFIGSSFEDVAGTVEIRHWNDRGVAIAQGDWICMKDTCAPHAELPGLVQRVVEYSVRVPLKTSTLIAWAGLEGESGFKLEGFTSLIAEMFAELRQEWDSETFPAFGDGNYDGWFKCHHAVTDAELEAQARQTFAIEPKFSIVVPLYNTPETLFREMADSVLAQSYAKLELILANSTPDNEELSALVKEYAEKDERIVRVDLAENRGITENTNEGIKAATGDFLCFLDHDDLITPDALYWYVRGINDYPETDLLYSDEDKVCDGIYMNPYFKPDWNMDLLTSMNYVCHFLCVRKSIVDELEPPTREYDGSQDHHLTLRASQRARNIYHARRVLYHWRKVKGSTAETIDAKPYAINAGIRAVQDYIDDRGWKGHVIQCPRVPDHYEVIYELEEHPLVSIIIPNKDSIDMLERCLKSIAEVSTYDNYEILIVENNSVEQNTFDYYERIEASDPHVRVMRFEGPFNYSKINNDAVEQARGDYLLLLNNDTEVISPDWIERLLALCMREGTGAAGARLLYPDNTIQHAGLRSSSFGPQHIGRFCDSAFPGYACMYTVRQDISAVTAACMMTTREAFERVGGFDENLSVAYNDVDYCYALIEAGYVVVYEPSADLYHYESVSRGSDKSRANAERFAYEAGIIRQKWPKYFGSPDPFGNPHFKQDSQGAYYRGFE